MSVPTTDPQLVPFSTNFGTRITANPSLYNLTAGDASDYMALHNPYVASVNTILSAEEAGARTKNMTEIRNACRDALLPYARQLYSTIQSDISVANADKVELGITIRKTPEPTPVPEIVPVVTIMSVIGRVVKIKVQENTPDAGRGLPVNVASAAIYTFVGEEAPSDPALYDFQGITTRGIITIEFPPTTPTGALIWISAQWGNRRGQFGVGSAPTSFTLQGGPAVAA